MVGLKSDAEKTLGVVCNASPERRIYHDAKTNASSQPLYTAACVRVLFLIRYTIGLDTTTYGTFASASVEASAGWMIGCAAPELGISTATAFKYGSSGFKLGRSGL